MSQVERHRWAVVASLFVVLFAIAGGTFLVFTVFLKPLVDHFHWSYGQTSLLFTTVLVVTALVSPLAGWLLERMSARMLINGGAVLTLVGFVIASRASSYAMMLTAYGVFGLGVGFSTLVPIQVVIASWFEHHQRATAIGVAMAGAPIGGLVLTMVSTYAVATWGWRTAYLVLAIPVVVLVIPLVTLAVQVRPAQQGERTGADAAESLPGLRAGEAFATHSFWLAMLLYLLNGFAIAIVLAHIYPILNGFGFSTSFAEKVVEQYLIMGAFGTILMGMLGDRVGGRAALAVCFVAIAFSFLALMHASNPVWRYLFIVMFGFNTTAPVSLMAILLIHTLGLKRFGFFSGVGIFLYNLGIAIGPFVAGHIYDVTRSYTGALELGGFVSLATAVLVLAVTVPQALKVQRSAALGQAASAG